MLGHIGILASHSDTFGEKKSVDEILEIIQQLPLLTSFISLSQISTEVYNEGHFKNNFKELYFNLLNDTFKKNPPPEWVSQKVYQELKNKINKIENTVAFSAQSILHMWKWLLAYGNIDQINHLQDSELNTIQLYYLSLMTNDYLYSGTNKNEELYAELF
ncbi:hypothetical protein V7068_22360, partial [Bacillus sp. JJ634]